MSKERQIRNGFIYLIPTAVGAMLSITTLTIFTRILTKEDYGFLGLAQVYAIFMTGLFNFGMLAAYERNFFEYSKDEKETSELLYSTLLFVGAAYLVGAAITYMLRLQLAGLIIGTSEQAGLLFWAFCSAGLMSFKQYYLTYFKNMEDAKSFVWYTVDESILGVVISIFLVAYMRIGVIGLVWGPMFASGVVLAALGLRFRRTLPAAFSWRILKGSLSLSYPLTPSLVFKIVANQFDKYMIGLLGSVGGVGIYSIGQRVANVVFICMTAVQNVFSPQVYRKMFEMGKDGGDAIGRYLTPFAYASIAVGLAVALFAEEAVALLTPKSYYGTADVVIVLSMLYGSYFFAKQPQLVFMKKTHVSSVLSIGSVLLNVGINIPFIMKWGAIGAAWGTLLAGIVSGAISFVISQRYYEIRWEKAKISAIFLIFFGSALSMVLLRSASVPYGARLAVKLALLVSYLWLGIKIGVLNRQNYLIVKRMIFPEKNGLRSPV